MNPMFFGASSNPLYGVYHPSNIQPAKKEGVLLCPPFGQEYMRSHRAFRQLALLLSKKGYAVMRFDYRGTGDSFGEIEDASISDWINDIETAVEELKETALVDTVHLVGLRLGGLLACFACNKNIEAEKLVLWDTVISGDAYDKELQIEMTKEGDDDAAYNNIDGKGTLHFNGFPLIKKLREELSKLDLTREKPKANKILHVVSQENDNSNLLKSKWEDMNNCEYSLAPAPGNWNYVDDFGGILLPQPVIQAIVSWIEQ